MLEQSQSRSDGAVLEHRDGCALMHTQAAESRSPRRKGNGGKPDTMPMVAMKIDREGRWVAWYWQQVQSVCTGRTEVLACRLCGTVL